MLSDRRGREYVRSLWVTVVAAVGLVLGLVVAPAATASSAADAAGSEASSAAADGANTNSVSGASGAAAADPVAYINAQNTGTVKQISAGQENTCAVTTGNTVYCWGLNKYGQLGNSTQDDSNVPVRVSDANGFVNGSVAQVSAGGSKSKGHTCAVTTNSGNTVYCWGSNQYGQLGNGLNTKSLVPVKVASGDDGFVNGSVRQVSAGKSYTCAVTTGNAVYCWGNNDGRLGNGRLNESSVPVRVSDANGFVNGSVQEVSAGFEHTCAVTGDTGTGGTVYCWGQNSQGQLGSGRPLSLVPVRVSDANGFVNGSVRQVSVGSEHTCAVTDAGAAYCWGKNGYGRLGNDSEVNSAVPVRVSTANGFVNGQVDQVSAGDYHTCAVTTGNTVYCWGRDNDEQLGNGLNTKSLVPVKVVDGTEGFVNGQVDQVSAGGYHTCAVTDVGAAYCWGKNDSGQLGNGTNTKSPVPVPVAGQLRVVPNPVEFGAVDAGKSKSKDVTVEHAFPLTAGAVVVDVGIISKPVGFSFAPGSGCTNDPDGGVLTLTDDTECTGVVKFAPKTPGEHGGIVSLTPRDYPNAGIQLSSSGFAPPGANPDGAVVKASSGAFGKVDVFTAKVKNIKITNVGDEPLRITGAKVKGDADDEFTASVKDCTQDPVAPGKSCKAKVQFFPRAAVESAALLDLKSNAIGGDTIALSGEGVVPVQETDADGDPIGPGKVRKLRVPDKTVTAKQATAKWKRPKGDVTVTGYETRFKKKKSGNWKKWSSKDPEPNLKGWIDRTFKKLSANTTYKVQVRAVSYEVRGKKSAVGFRTDRKGIPTRPANG